jgi:benzoate-CoA ligase family protein
VVTAGSYNAAVDLVDSNVSAGRGDKIAFIDPTSRVSYRELQARTDRMIAVLRGLGLAREQRVALVLTDTVAFPIAFWGTIKAGLVAVPLNTLLGAEQWGYMIDDCRAAAVIVSSELWERAAPVLDRLRRAGVPTIVSGRAGGEGSPSLTALLDQADPHHLPADTHADEVAFWLYTSGSTGTPKGARHVHASPRHTASLFGQGVLGIGEGDLVFSAAKLFFAYGLGNAMSFPLSVGATAFLLPDRPSPEAVLEVLRAQRPTIFCGVPTLYAALLAHPDLERDPGFPGLRACVSAGEALPAEIGKRWRDRVGVEVLDGIGSTEMLHIFLSNRFDALRYGSSGKPVPGYQARIVNEDGTPTTPGEIGELIVSGPTAAEGYWNQRERSRRTFAGEWTHTGDKYRIDPDGYYHYCGRTDDMFKTSGIWVSPFEVESALVTHPAVVEAAVIGQDDGTGLIKPKAFVVLAPGREPSEALYHELRELVKERAGPWKYPRWIESMSELPKTATGKIQRFKLRAREHSPR